MEKQNFCRIVAAVFAIIGIIACATHEQLGFVVAFVLLVAGIVLAIRTEFYEK